MYAGQAKVSQAEGAVFQVQSLGSTVEPGAGAAPGAGVMGEDFQAQSKVYGAQSAASSVGSLFRGLGLNKLKPKKPAQAEQLAAAAAPAAPVAAAAPGAASPPVGESPAPGAAPAPPAPPGYQTWMWPSAEVERKSPWKKVLILVFLIALLAGAAAVIWYTLIRDDSESKPAATKSQPTTTAKKPAVTPNPKPKPAGGVRAFVLDLEPLLKASAANRVKIVAAVRGVSNGCSLAPEQGAAQAEAVEKSRSALLKRVNAVNAPNAQTAAVLASFKQALTASIDANQHYAKWMQSLKGASPCPGSPTSNDDFNAAEAASTKATAAKLALTKQYNPLATKYGRQTFSPDKI
jgi:hypothetical protein